MCLLLMFYRHSPLSLDDITVYFFSYGQSVPGLFTFCETIDLPKNCVYNPKILTLLRFLYDMDGCSEI